MSRYSRATIELWILHEGIQHRVDIDAKDLNMQLIPGQYYRASATLENVSEDLRPEASHADQLTVVERIHAEHHIL